MAESLVDYYRAIERASAEMLEAAQAENWELVVRQVGNCAVLIEQLRHRAQVEDIPKEHRGEKARIMQRILQNDATIRFLAEPWLGDPDSAFPAAGESPTVH